MILAKKYLTFKNESQANCLKLEVLLQEKIKRDTSTSLMDINPLNCSSSSQPVVQNVYNSTIKHIPVYKWYIQFSGDKCSRGFSFIFGTRRRTSCFASRRKERVV